MCIGLRFADSVGMQDSTNPTAEQERYGDVALGMDVLPEPLNRILADVHRMYQARSPEELVTLLRRRYRADATFTDPTLAARPRQELGLQFYALQHLFSSIHITDISPPEVQLVPQDKGPNLLQVIVHSRQHYNFARSNHISQQILPECIMLETTTRLLLDMRTGQVLHHEDSWDNKQRLKLPMAWRRLNSICTNAVYRLLGWQRNVADAERRCSGGGEPAAGSGTGSGFNYTNHWSIVG